MTTTHTPPQGENATPQTMTIRYGDGYVTTFRAVPLDGGHVSWQGESPDPGDSGALVSLLGFAATITPDVNGYPATYRAPLYYMAHALPELDALRGMFAQFGGEYGMFGWGAPVAEVTL